VQKRIKKVTLRVYEIFLITITRESLAAQHDILSKLMHREGAKSYFKFSEGSFQDNGILGAGG
jgi:hypothetical protein